MRRLTLLICFFGLLFAHSATEQEDIPPLLALTNVTVIDGTGTEPMPDRTVLIEGERIADVFKSGDKPLPGNVEQMDLSGKYLIPGLINTHGTIEPGKAASLVVLGEDPTRDIGALRSIVTVFKRGQQYPRSDYRSKESADESAPIASADQLSPSSYSIEVLPSQLLDDAVDRAGREAPFTSHGKIDIFNWGLN